MTCSIVLIAVPVVTAVSAAVVGAGPFQVIKQGAAMDYSPVGMV